MAREDIDEASLAGRLQQAMELRRTNPNRVAEATGVTRQMLYAALQGRTRNFTYQKLVVVSEHLGVRPEWLARGEGPMFPVTELKDEDEVALVRAYRQMSLSHQRDLTAIAQKWAEDDIGQETAGSQFHYARPLKRQ